ncbi:MAG: hypothetical protein FJZ38_04440 [Candidatus Rokubacteria bacterium]|nr:hypothetical protein [Candidatus Rokubacteria bacterium]
MHRLRVFRGEAEARNRPVLVLAHAHDDGPPIRDLRLGRRGGRGRDGHRARHRAHDLREVPRLVGRRDLDDVGARLQRRRHADGHAAADDRQIAGPRDLEAVHGDLHAIDGRIVRDEPEDDDRLALC